MTNGQPTETLAGKNSGSRNYHRGFSVPYSSRRLLLCASITGFNNCCYANYSRDRCLQDLSRTPNTTLEDLFSLKTHAKTICIPGISSGGFWSRPLHQNTPANTASGTFPRQSQSSPEPPYKISFISPHKHCLFSFNSFKAPIKCRKSQG